MSVTTCRAIWERRNRNKNKSEEGTTPESHHSGSAIEQIAPSQNPDEIVKTVHEQVNEKPREEDVLVIDDDTEKAIMKEVLTLPQCVEKKVQDIRKEGASPHINRNIVILNSNKNNIKKKTPLTKKKPKMCSNYPKITTMIFERRRPQDAITASVAKISVEKIPDVQELKSEVISDEEDQVRSVEYEDHAQKDIARNLNSGISSDILSNNGFLALSRQDFRTLTGKNHINDKIIDEYLHLIQRRSQLPGNKKSRCIALSCLHMA